ncbi:hypothetical protein BT96DRAFT_840293 [Gymnopus androsaceus JB14]|uniref:Uncharacterized protein n=1 Tax=Gymnopus androsaceus JB14 TaxID=1447944 RepID=A0A6A4GJ84_9AGAR|nr:hypothetical protein BT96DRAFT_840293 [Gymnopus androsaceus JB14]
MTLLCRHDRLLFTVNMNTPGEGQHYVLALLAKLFETFRTIPSSDFSTIWLPITPQLCQVGLPQAIHVSYDIRGVYLSCIRTSVALPDDLPPTKVYWMRSI